LAPNDTWRASRTRAHVACDDRGVRDRENGGRSRNASRLHDLRRAAYVGVRDAVPSVCANAHGGASVSRAPVVVAPGVA
jgi:hypothetical protein